MQAWEARGWLRLMVGTLLVLLALSAVLLTAMLIFPGLARGPVIRYVEIQSGRRIRVEGKFEAHLLSLHPRIVAERVTIGNPPWTSSGITAEIGHLSLTGELPWFGRPFGFRRLEMDEATLYPSRDEAGRANWQWHQPGSGRDTGPPLIRSLLVPNARVHFEDRRLHLQFDGTVTGQDARRPGPQPPLRIEGTGQLNGRRANFILDGDPLATVAREQPYRFELTANSSGTRLEGHGLVPHPFDFRVLETTFEAVGEDLQDLYFLTGVSLPETGAYQLSGKLTREGRFVRFTDLDARSGESDLRGAVLIATHQSAPPHVEADLRSRRLRLSDLGRRAAGRAPPAGGKRLLIPDTPFHLTGMRHSDAVINFHAQTLEAGRIALRPAAATVRIDRGAIVVVPLSASLQEGNITGEIKLNITQDVPAADLDLKVADVKLGQLARNSQPDTGNDDDPPPFDGPLKARIILNGRGSSMHQLASKANGRVTVVLPRGALRSSFAELAGLDLRGLGLMVSKDKSDTDIRCAVASFAMQDGLLTAQRLVIDTEPVLVTGEGTIDLESEGLDLQLQGRPKHPRLRMRAPLLVRGTLAHPSLSMEAKKPVAQAGGALALGMLLTPVAAMLAFVDPGLAKDTDCAALLAEATSRGP